MTDTQIPMPGFEEPDRRPRTPEASDAEASTRPQHHNSSGLLMRRALRRAAPWIVAAAAALGAAAFMWASSRPATHTATTVIELLDDTVGMSQHTVSEDELEAERQILESSLLRADLDAALGADASDVIDVTATTTDESRLITLDVTARDSDVAIRAVQNLIDVFTAQRAASQIALFTDEAVEIRARIDEQEQLVADLEQELDAVNDVDPSTSEVVSASALETRLITSIQRSQELQQVLRELETETTLADGRISVIDRATGTQTNQRNALLTGIQVALLAATLGAGVTALASSRRRVFQLTLELEETYPDIPVLAAVPRFRPRFRERKNSVVVGREDAMREAEAFRFLRTAVELATPTGRSFSVAVTSSMPGEGKTVSAANLAVSCAASGRRTMLVDGDLLSPSIPELSGRPEATNTLPYLLAGCDPAEVLTSIGTSERSLDLLIGHNPPELDIDPGRLELTVDELRRRFESLQRSYDTIIVDCPPTVLVADAVTLAAATAGVVIVVRLGQAHRDGVARVVDALEQGGANILGFLATHATPETGYGDYRYEIRDRNTTPRVKSPANVEPNGR